MRKYFCLLMGSIFLFIACDQTDKNNQQWCEGDIQPLTNIQIDEKISVRQWQESTTQLKAYRTELDSMRAEFSVYEMPAIRFFLFGMGNRTKYLYKDGKLIDSFSKKTMRKWDIESELILPSLYKVVLKTKSGEIICLEEDEDAFWIYEAQTGKAAVKGTKSKLILPDFKGHKYPQILRVLHQEVLINIVNGTPLPNYFVYDKGWRRDGAMMAMCLEATGNVDLIKQWVLSLDSPYDRNNAGETEADNLGQTLYLISLFSDKSHPLVGEILNEAKKYEKTNADGKYIEGRSDFHLSPVYQTKFLKWGLKKLALPDPYIIPEMSDTYATLFWWDYTDQKSIGVVNANGQLKDDKYPYLGWATDHFHHLKQNPISNQDYPLTWEAYASEAKYKGMKMIDKTFENKKISTPHTWHSAEVFLYLLELKNEIKIEKDLLYDQHTLEDTYPYGDTVRVFQWDKMRKYLSLVDSIQQVPSTWGILQNRNNKNGEAPLVKVFHRNVYQLVVDTFGIERFQAVPLYMPNDTVLPERYGLDGSLVKIKNEMTNFTGISTIYFDGDWVAPKKYIKNIGDSIKFHKIIFVDRTNQNIATLERSGLKWLVRSMNPATTGLHKPPLMHETPLGIFVIQEKKQKMVYLEDNSTATGGFAPYASRFSNGGYVHGVPVNVPRTTTIEFSPSLGTTPRSHMCVRNATSHSKFVYDWAPVEKSLVIVFD